MGEETVRERVDEHVRMQCASIFLGSEMRRKWWLRQSGSRREGRGERTEGWDVESKRTRVESSQMCERAA